MDETLRKLEEQEAALTRELEEKRKAIQAWKNSHVALSITKIQDGKFYLSGPYHEKLISIYRAFPNRRYEAAGINSFPLSTWVKLEEQIRAIEGLQITIDIPPDLVEELNRKHYDYRVIKTPRDVQFSSTNGQSAGHFDHKFRPILGSSYDWNEKRWHIPLSEAWRLPELLDNMEEVEWSETAWLFVQDELRLRERLNGIASREGSTFVHDYLPHIWKRMEKRGTKIRPFQETAVEYIAANGGRMILADDTGLGKTWEMLLYSLWLQSLRPKTVKTLCVVKAANIPNWRAEIRDLCDEEPLVLQGGKPDIADVQEIMNGQRYTVISYDTLGSKMTIRKDDGTEQEMFPWVQVFLAAQMDLLLADEAHMVKTPSANRSRALRVLSSIPHVIPATASPVLNRTSELWSLLHMVEPKTFHHFAPFVEHYTVQGRQPKNVKLLHEMLQPRFLRRTKSQVLKDLPPINRIYRFHELSEKAKRSVAEIYKGIYTTLAEFDPLHRGGQQTEVMSVLAEITRLKQVCAVDKIDYTADLARDLSDENEGKKVLIFSHFKGVAANIARALGHEAVCTVERTEAGFTSMNAEARHALFESVKDEPTVKFIVTTEAAKEGHNLQWCDFVLFNDPFWTPAAHYQCEGRAYGRLADPHPIDAYYIIAEEQTEKWILELLKTKLDIIGKTVEGVEGSRDDGTSMVRELIIRLMKARG